MVRERGLDTRTMALYVLLLNAGMFVGYQLLGWLADRIGKRGALLVCFAGATLLLPLYALIRDPRLLLWCGPLVALFFAYAGPFGAYFPALYPTRVRSLGAGFCFNVGRGIAAFAPFVLGTLAARYGLATAIGLCAVGFLLAGLVMLALPETPPGRCCRRAGYLRPHWRISGMTSRANTRMERLTCSTFMPGAWNCRASWSSGSSR
jgi:MFS family permease